MGKNTKIGWCDHTINLWWGCTQVQENRGCDYCYAKDWDRRFADGSHWGNRNLRRETSSVWKELSAIQNRAKKNNRLETAFVMSMGDIFENNHMTQRGSTINALRQQLFSEIGSGRYPNLIWLFLTKRPHDVNRYLPEYWYQKCPDNIWIGASVSEQKMVDKSIMQLLDASPAGIKHFLSVEPLLEEVTLAEYLSFEYFVSPSELEHHADSGSRTENLIDWVIVGGESGKHCRPMKQEWAERIKEECEEADVPFFFKQAGNHLAKEWKCSDPKGELLSEFPATLQVRQFPIWNTEFIQT